MVLWDTEWKQSCLVFAGHAGGPLAHHGCARFAQQPWEEFL